MVDRSCDICGSKAAVMVSWGVDHVHHRGGFCNRCGMEIAHKVKQQKPELLTILPIDHPDVPLFIGGVIAPQT